MADVSMPRLSDSMEEGTIVKWLKSDGDQVRRGEEIVEIETDKANMTYEADDDGVLSIVAGEGDTLPVGELIARIGERAAQGDGEAGEESGGSRAEDDAGAERDGDGDAARAEDEGDDGAQRDRDGEAARAEDGS